MYVPVQVGDLLELHIDVPAGCKLTQPVVNGHSMHWTAKDPQGRDWYCHATSLTNVFTTDGAHALLVSEDGTMHKLVHIALDFV